MTDEDILNICYDKRSYINARIIQEIEHNNSKFNDIKNYLNNRFIDSYKSTYRELITRIKYKINEIPKCPVCGNDLHFIGKKNRIYSLSCSVQCTMKNDIVKNKIKQTNLKKYGYEHNWQFPEEQAKSHSKEAINKCFETQKKNGTINKSKEEDKSYNLLKEKFNNVERNYKCERYPFACDFYIPALDLFIECQYSMFHNHKPYLGTKENLKELNLIKEKSEKLKKKLNKTRTRYDAVIETWTIRDVNKRNIAKQNNLNYLEFFTILDLQNWLNTNNNETK